MKRKLIYITFDGWWDTDINILPDLGNAFDLTVYVFSKKDPKVRKFPKKVLPDYIDLHEINFIRPPKHPLTAILSLYYACKTLWLTRNTLTFWVLDPNKYFVLPLLLLSSSKNYIISYHNYIEHTDCDRMTKWLKKAELSKYNYFHLQSSGQEVYFKKDHPDKHSFSTSMAVKNFGEAEVTNRYFNNEKRTFLFFGFLRDYKRPDMFLKLASAFKDKANFIIAGNSHNWQKLASLAEGCTSLRADIKFIANEDIPNYFCQADFLVLPYEDSTQSGPLLTAYNYYLPIIASDQPYFKEMVHDGVDGFIFQTGSQEALNAVTSRAIGLSDGEYKQMKANMRKTVETYKKATDFAKSLEIFVEENKL